MTNLQYIKANMPSFAFCHLSRFTHTYSDFRGVEPNDYRLQGGEGWVCQMITDYMGRGAGIDEMPKSEIEKRKRNMESISRISRREKRNVEICFLVREENENFCKK